MEKCLVIPIIGIILGWCCENNQRMKLEESRPISRKKVDFWKCNRNKINEKSFGTVL